MWPWILLSGAIGVATKLLLDRNEHTVDQDRGPRVRDASPELDQNLWRLRHELNLSPTRPRVFFVGIGGAGKSSLADAITNQECVPRPQVGIETDATDWSRRPINPATLTWNDVMIVDAPGYGTVRHPTEVIANELPFDLADVIVFVISGKILADDLVVFQSATTRVRGSIVLVRNKVDTVYDATPEQAILATASDLSASATIEKFAVSARSGSGIERLREVILERVSRARLERS